MTSTDSRRPGPARPGAAPSDLPAFDICDPLPTTGTTLLEASAGTGKTWTIGALVTRYVAEGHARLDQMLVVTFGRAASQELRERVRTQLVEADHALSDPDAHRGASDLVDLLLDDTDHSLELKHARVREALATFDAATIATTHQFCSMVLGSLGVAGDTDSRARLVEDLEELLTEVVDDLYLRAFARDGATPEFTRSEAMRIARVVVNDPQARIEPAGADEPPVPARKVAFARAVRDELDRRKRRLGILSYDDLLSQLRDALAGRGPHAGSDEPPARTRMRQRWKIVLVDEFQDTDPVQWQVLDLAFSGVATMILIGDPKQAIYAFRGGDVVTYLEAARTATTRKTLGVNWRSDAPLVTALQSLLEGASLGHDDIVVHPVEAHHGTSRLAGAPVTAPVRLRVVRRADLGRTGSGNLPMDVVRARIAKDLACDVRRLLASGATWDGRPLEPRDIAVIAYRHADLTATKQALHELGIPAVIAGGGSVFATPAALEWLTLLEALEQPHRIPRVRAAALTPFVGATAAGLDAGGDAETDRLAEQMRDWAELFARRGIAAVLEAAASHGLAARVLSLVDGERELTDLRHVAEVLHETGLRERFGLVSTIAWLRSQIAEARERRGTERTRRLDSDAAAVQLVTIHASKGLEYPLVYLPSLGDRFVGKPDLPLFHDAQGRRCRNVANAGSTWADHTERARLEESGEWLRLLYVAMTRARSQVVAWWSPCSNAPASPLHRLLFGRSDDGTQVADPVPNVSDAEAFAALSRWRERGALVLEVADAEVPAEQAPGLDRPAMAERHLDRAVDVAWMRRSYSSLTAVELTPLPGVGSEPEERPKDDEEVVGVAAVTAADPAQRAGDVPSPMADLPAGATFGSLVHAVLEHADPAAPLHDGDLRRELLGHVDEQLVRWPVPDLDRDALADALVEVCDSPMGPLTGGLRLRDLPLGDRLRELEFELPLSGGDDRRHRHDEITLGQVAVLLRRHLPEGDPVRGYAETLDHPLLGGQPLRGYLTGSIDLAMRVDGRYFVVDYKTNWLGPPDEPLTAHHYRPEALDAAMAHSDYPLQALLYALVLHRFLRWRLADYDPETHLGGVLYLYLRGMCGAATPSYPQGPSGVFSWRPPVALVEELSDLMDGVAP